MRVLHVFNDSRPGGIEVLAPEVIKRLGDGHHKFNVGVYVIHASRLGAQDVFSISDISYTKGASKSASNYWRYKNFLHKESPDLLHIFNCSPVTVIIAGLLGIEHVVYSLRGERFGSNRMRHYYAVLIWRMALLFKPCLLANSNHTAAVFRRRISSKASIRVIYNPLHITVPNMVQRSVKDSFTVIYCGRLSEGKNLYLWLEVAKLISNRFPLAVFRLYGEGLIKSELFAYAEMLGIADRTEFMGQVQDIVQAYLSADLLMFLSKYESFGNVVVESIVCGLPVLCSDIPSLKEIFTEYPEFIVPLGDQLIPEVLGRLENYQHLKDSALKAREQFITKFSLESHVRQLTGIYDQLLS